MSRYAIVQALQQCIFRRYAANAHKTLQQVYRIDRDLLNVQPELLHFAHTEREGIYAALRHELAPSSSQSDYALLPIFLAQTKHFIFQQNQFLHMSSLDDAALNTLYRDFLADLLAIVAQQRDFKELNTLFKKALERHFLLLHDFAASVLKENSASDDVKHVFFSNPVCSEYSAPLQMTLLGLDLSTLREPVLDVGCGAHGHLVRYLRQTGLEAFGLDREVEDCPCLFEGDWLEWPFQPGQWGTILSHMAFSHHFRFQHLYTQGHPEHYAHTFMKMLTALHAQGMLCYTPGLPFIEPLLPESQYLVTRHRIPQAFLSPGQPFPERLPDAEDMFSTTTITKIQ